MFNVLRCDANYLFADDLLNVDIDTLSHTEHELIGEYRTLDEHGKVMVEIVMRAEAERQRENMRLSNLAEIRYIRHYLTPAAAGFANPIEGEDYELIAAGDDVPKNADFCIDIVGDSMEPYIKDGERVYVKRDAAVNEYSDVGVFYYDGAVLCKQFYTDRQGTLYLLSANPKRADMNVRISYDAASTLVCFGKVMLKKKLPKPVYV